MTHLFRIKNVFIFRLQTYFYNFASYYTKSKRNFNMKIRLIILSFLQFAIWGAYLTSMGGYLASVGIGANIGWFYSAQGFVSIFMPAIIGIAADRWVQAQKMLSFCHLVSTLCMLTVGYMGMTYGENVTFGQLFPVYTVGIAFYMPTLALSNSVSYNALEKSGLDTVAEFPSIRIFGTIGFIVSMWIVDFTHLSTSYWQFFISAAWGLLMAVYSLTMPKCPTKPAGENKSLKEALGLDAFFLFKQPRMAMFFIFSMLLGVCLQITNGYASPFIQSFAADANYAGCYFVEHANLLISLSQMSETFCILLIPFFMKRYGIKTIMLIAMLAWVCRFGFFAVGNPSMSGVGLLIISMIVYGVAFDFFNISGSLFVDRETAHDIRSSAQGLFMLMTNGLGAGLGMIAAQLVVNSYTTNEGNYQVGEWSTVWFIFAAYALAVSVLFALLFKDSKESK